ncbi:cytochrome c [Runella sp.]|jgi:mono/diheme cytochrome c family protein|uniref:c-type cytochrome n=1 Tax=Runella sp. TaxID=1960881 RepID=UPI0026045A48|nr:cytochrome c [Runella sp.]
MGIKKVFLSVFLILRICFLFLCFFSIFLLNSCQSEGNVKRDQYIAEGFTLYQTHCANCHQRDGKGLENLYPALSSEYLMDKSNVICWIKNGINQPMTVNGKIYNRAMPANPALKDLETAEIVTYVYATWGKQKEITPIETVQEALEECVSK